MAQWNRELEDLGRNVQAIVDQAINSQDYQKLNETIRQTVGKAVDLGSGAVRSAMEKKAARTSQPVQEAPKTQNLTVLRNLVSFLRFPFRNTAKHRFPSAELEKEPLTLPFAVWVK